MSRALMTERREVEIPGTSGLTLRIYGVDASRSLSERMAQAYCVVRNQVATARTELSPGERSSLQAYLNKHHPEHATI